MNPGAPIIAQLAGPTSYGLVCDAAAIEDKRQDVHLLCVQAENELHDLCSGCFANPSAHAAATTTAGREIAPRSTRTSTGTGTSTY